MKAVRRSLCLLAFPLVVVLAGALVGQEKPVEEKPGKAEQQKDQAYKTQDGYREKVESLKKQIKELKTKEKAEWEAVLTDKQKKLLEKLDGEKK